MVEDRRRDDTAMASSRGHALVDERARYEKLDLSEGFMLVGFVHNRERVLRKVIFPGVSVR
jgi:hypothetical protein